MRHRAPIRVLIADDHEIVRRGITLVLETEEGLRVVGEARSGREAVELTLAERPDVLLLDLRMPDLDGLSVLRTVKRRVPSTKVILLTAFETDEALVDALQEGAEGVLFKDVPPGELSRAIRLVAEGEAYLQPSVAQRVVQLMARRTAEEAWRGRQLTPRERDILRLMARGYSNQEIAAQTGVSPETVRSHVKSILQKLDASNRTRAIVLALRLGLVTLNDVTP